MSLDPTYSEQVTRRILTRAVELDHIRSGNYSLADLRAMAAEVGVSDAALEQAMREVSGDAALSSAATPRRNRMLMPILAAGAAVLGLSGGIIDMTTAVITSPLVMGILLMLSGGLAVSQDYSNARRGWHRFLISNTVLWATYGVSWALAASTADVPRVMATVIFLRVGVVGWTLSSAFGSIIALLQSRRGANAGTGTDANPPLKRRIAEKLKTWIDIWATRISIDDIWHDRGSRASLTR